MAQTVARRRTVAQTNRSRKRVPEDVARETFCSTCSPRVGGNNTGYAATSGPDWHAGSRLHWSSASYPTPASNHRLPKPNSIFIIPGAARRHKRLTPEFTESETTTEGSRTENSNHAETILRGFPCSSSWAGCLPRCRSCFRRPPWPEAGPCGVWRTTSGATRATASLFQGHRVTFSWVS